MAATSGASGTRAEQLAEGERQWRPDEPVQLVLRAGRAPHRGQCLVRAARDRCARVDEDAVEVEDHRDRPSPSILSGSSQGALGCGGRAFTACNPDLPPVARRITAIRRRSSPPRSPPSSLAWGAVV